MALAEDSVVGTFVDLDGYEVDLETGEVLGCRDAREEFVVVDREGAEWVLEKLALEQAAVVAAELRLSALRENIEAQVRRAEARVRFFQARFGEQLRQFAIAQLAGGKSKTLTLDHGRIELRESQERFVIRDMDGAVAFAEEFAPDAVTITKKVTKTDLIAAASIEDPAELPFFDRIPSVSYANIKTGVGRVLKVAEGGAEVEGE